MDFSYLPIRAASSCRNARCPTMDRIIKAIKGTENSSRRTKGEAERRATPSIYDESGRARAAPVAPCVHAAGRGAQMVTRRKTAAAHV